MNETEGIAWIRGHVDDLNTTDYNFHPAILDGVFQVRRFIEYWAILYLISIMKVGSMLGLGKWCGSVLNLELTLG